MDYAKLALLKAEELERKGKAITGGEISRIGLIYEKKVAAGEVFKLCSISGDGEAGLIVSLSLTDLSLAADDSTGAGSDGGTGTTGEIDFIIDGKKVFTRPLSASPLFMASPLLSGEVKVCIKPSVGITLVSADVMIMGGKVLNTAAYGVHVAKSNGVTAAAYITDGEVRVSVSKAGGLVDMTKYTIVGFGIHAAITQVDWLNEDSFVVCHIDTEGNVFLSAVSILGALLSTTPLDITADNLAIINQGGFLTLGYCYKGCAYATVLSYPDIWQQYTIKLEEATSIEFVRDCRPPAVILGKKSGSIIRMARDEAVSDEAVNILVDCYF